MPIQSSTLGAASVPPADILRNTAYSFCKAFISGRSPRENLDEYFARDARIFEHGPSWARSKLPFLGLVFQGRRETTDLSAPPSHKTCDDYYDLLGDTLSFHPLPNTLPSPHDFMVDPTKGTVTVKMHAKFASIKTGKSWEEDFVYILGDFDEEGRIGCQELWADPLSAWLAVTVSLDQ